MTESGIDPASTNLLPLAEQAVRLIGGGQYGLENLTGLAARQLEFMEKDAKEPIYLTPSNIGITPEVRRRLYTAGGMTMKFPIDQIEPTRVGP